MIYINIIFLIKLKIILLYILLFISIYTNKYCDDEKNVSGYKDCKDLEINPEAGDKCCYMITRKSKSDDTFGFIEKKFCMTLNTSVSNFFKYMKELKIKLESEGNEIEMMILYVKKKMNTLFQAKMMNLFQAKILI